MKALIAATVGLLLVALAPVASAEVITLFDWGLNVNGTVYTNTTAVPGLNAAAFDTATGLGSLTLTFNPGAAGSYYVLSFFDHEIDELTNTYFNEFGSVVGAPPAGLSWEIDEPGFGNLVTLYTGDIYDHFLAGGGALDNSAVAGPEDISMALGWNFILAADEKAVIKYSLATAAPASGFYLHQSDPESTVAPMDVYFSTDVDIQTVGTIVPEPGTVALLAAGLLSLLCFSRKKVRG